MRSYLLLLLLVLLTGCATQPRERTADRGYTELVKLECTRILHVDTNKNGVSIRYWDTKCRETSKELLPQP